jgi:hypothetical protein
MELYPLIGYYRESTRYTSPENVPRSQTPGLNIGTAQFRFKIISDAREVVDERGIQHKVYVKVIETKTEIPFKVGDKISIGAEDYRISQVDKHIPQHKEGIVRRWPKSLEKYQVTRLTL